MREEYKSVFLTLIEADNIGRYPYIGKTHLLTNISARPISVDLYR